MKKLGLMIAMGLLAAACNGGYSTQESNQICRDELETRMISSDKEAFEKCVLCYEECSNCMVESSKGSVIFACPTDE